MSSVAHTTSPAVAVCELPDLTGQLLTACSVEETLAWTLDGVARYVPASVLAAGWDVQGSTGGVVLSGRHVSQEEAQLLVDQAVGTGPYGSDMAIGPPRFVRAMRVRARHPGGGLPDWTHCLYVGLAPNSAVGFAFHGDGPDPAEGFEHPDVIVLLHCAAACVCRLCIEAGGDSVGGKLQPSDDLLPVLDRLRTDATDRGVDLAVMLVEPMGPDDEVTEEAIAAIGHMLVGTLRNSDLVFRAGPRHFCAVMPRTNPRHALIAAGRMTGRLQESRPPEVPAGVRLAIGVSGLDESAAPAEQLYAQSESALAEARSPDGAGVFLHL